MVLPLERLRLVGLGLAAAAFATACGGSTTSGAPANGDGGPGAPVSPTPGTPGTPATPGTEPMPAPPGSLSVTFGPVTVAPGTERTQCVTKRLGNAAAMHVARIQNALSKTSHHLIVYRVNDTQERATPYDCRPFADTSDPTKGAPLMITQKAEDVLVLPAGVAYAMAPTQMIRLEVHYLNAGVAPADVTATSTFVPADESTFRDEADVVLVGNVNIRIPPKSTATLGPTFIALPSLYAGVNFFALTGHEHQYGTGVTVATATAASDPGKPVYDVPDWTWSEPKTVFPEPHFTVPTGGGFKLTCNWTNTSDKALGFGESAESEMCFFWAYYYPRKAGSRVILGR